MAGPIITWAFEFEIHYVDKLVLVAIADDADKAGVSKYLGSLRTFGKQCTLSERQVRRSLRRLETWGLVKTYPQQRPNGSDTVHIFQCAITVDAKKWNQSRPADAIRKGRPKGASLEGAQDGYYVNFTKAFEKALETKFDKQTFHTWVAPCRVVSIQKGRLTMGVPKLAFGSFLHDHLGLIQEAATETDPSIKKVHILLPNLPDEN